MDLHKKIILAIIIALVILIANIWLKKKELKELKKLRELKCYNILKGKPSVDYNKRRDLNKELRGIYASLWFLIVLCICCNVDSVKENQSYSLYSIVLITLIYAVWIYRYVRIFMYVLFYSFPIVVECLKEFQVIGDSKILLLILLFVIYILIPLFHPILYLRELNGGVTVIPVVITGLLTIINWLGVVKLDVEFITVMYTVGWGLISYKKIYYRKQADKIYLKLKSGNLQDTEKIYVYCKECVFYGGEEYKNKILKNKRLYDIVMQKE